MNPGDNLIPAALVAKDAEIRSLTALAIKRGRQIVEHMQASFTRIESLEQKNGALVAEKVSLEQENANLRALLGRILISPTGECRLCGFLDSQEGHIDHCKELTTSVKKINNPQ